MVRVAPCGQWMPLSVIMPVNAWLKGVVRHRRHQLASGSSSNARYAMSYRLFMSYGVIDELRPGFKAVEPRHLTVHQNQIVAIVGYYVQTALTRLYGINIHVTEAL